MFMTAPKTFFADLSKSFDNSFDDKRISQMAGDPEPVQKNGRRTSIRFRIAFGFLICFFLALSITLLSLYVFIRLQTKIHFLEVADNFMLTGRPEDLKNFSSMAQISMTPWNM
jgi:hypothetical protein